MKFAKTKYGIFEGVKEDGYSVFKGIPYAAPPVGDLRFKAPKKPDLFSKVKKADTFPNAPMQTPPPADDFYAKEFGLNKDIKYSEDCLYLNIWTPAKTTDDDLAVAVWLYGGGLVSGYSAEKEFDGKEYAKRNVILVTVNYRVGIFGFLCHPWLAEENKGRCGNYGVLDQLAALKWVKENIDAFGGNPDNITLFGQSSGALTSQTLLLSPLTKGLINKCIMQSGAGYENGFCKNNSQEYFYDLGEKAVQRLGVHSLDELRKVSAKRLLEISDEMIGYYCSLGKGLGYEPVIDGYLLTGDSEQNLKNGFYPDIPYMLGSTANDICTPEDRTIPMEQSQLHIGCINWCRHQIELGNKPSYVYYFSRRLPGDDFGAFHSSELWYMFATLERSWRPFTEKDRELSEAMLDYWCNFIKTGNPNGNGLKMWNPWTENNPQVMIFDVN